MIKFINLIEIQFFFLQFQEIKNFNDEIYLYVICV